MKNLINALLGKNIKNVKNLQKQLHVGTPIGKEVSVRPIGKTLGNKPTGGLWTSTWNETGSAWTNFCEREEFGLPEDNEWKGVFLEPKKSAVIYTVDCEEDLVFLADKYGKEELFGLFFVLDFEKIALDYDAIHLTKKGEQETRMSEPCSLYGWDVESTLWFRAAFNIVEEEVRFPYIPCEFLEDEEEE